MTGLRPLDALRAVRQRVHRALLRYPNVIGTGLGVKRRGGEVFDQHALVVFVSSKVAPEQLERRGLLPKFVMHQRQRIAIDVVPINRVRREFGNAPYTISDEATRGTLSAFARGDDGFLYGVSCAHCLAGPDGNPHTASPIGVWDPLSETYMGAGQNVFAVEAPGYGLPGDFGFSDAGLIILEHPQLAQRARTAPALRILEHPVRGTAVFAQAYATQFSGAIDALDVVISDLRVDVLIRVSGSGTFPGHSGMLWRTQSGQAVGLHAYGAGINDITGGSGYSLAMLARRAAYQLQVQLLDTG